MSASQCIISGHVAPVSLPTGSVKFLSFKCQVRLSWGLRVTLRLTAPSCVVFISLAHYYGRWEETVPPMRVVNSRFRLCTSLVPRPMSVVFGLGTRLHVRMRTKLENGIPSQRTVTTECCEWTRVNLKL